MENSASDFEQHIPSFFKNSCPGTSAEVVTEKTASPKTVREALQGLADSLSENQAVVGGITCCVPGCFSNSLRNPELSFYVIPNGKSKEKQQLHKRCRNSAVISYDITAEFRQSWSRPQSMLIAFHRRSKDVYE